MLPFFDDEGKVFGLPQQQASLFLAAGGLIFIYTGICGTLSFFLGPSGFFAAVLQLVFITMCWSEAVERGHPTLPKVVPLGVATAVFAALVGTTNYQTNYAPYAGAKAGRGYSQVVASAKASAHADGGVISFANDTVLDGSRAFGFWSHGHTYCVAPILSRVEMVSSRSAAPMVQFWAVGLDCCSKWGDFECDDAGNRTAHGGLVLHDSGEVTTSTIFARSAHRLEFLRAVKAASAVHELPTAAAPVLLRWTSDPDSLLFRWHCTAWLVWIVSSIIYAVITSTAWASLHKYYDSKIQRAAGAAQAGGQNEQNASQRRVKDPFLLVP
mmetsp:Transcript_33772/g.73922  ORF Transcript_33772/g.73922 Transcript_33772/m.73922 type:complete len:326 (-) Transcript_33772:82-1059(-)|eukprot:CAMPEP_0170601022 /NCGR_PEP_ID=MMETSP0224-20130122/17638_1 /TAXON_ID=285029 /ORGANISM="Togula jolla, Strain CCCM 725" /LENGTH=325 /DNA_ID=CAMNT_0010925771 /DNA_START=68 /DNA_END=1045 /DNA_ORIENTATION=+